MAMYRICLILLLLSVSAASFAQSKRFNKQEEAYRELSRSLEEGQSDRQLAKDYETLAREQMANHAYRGAEENLVKAKNIYIRLKETEEVARIERELGKLQERQNKIQQAIASYQAASRTTKNKRNKAINESDAKRLMNQSNAYARSRYINQKIELLEKDAALNTGIPEDEIWDDDRWEDEISDAYSQMAEVNVEQKQPERAISNYETALKKASQQPPESQMKITREMANVYASNQQMDKAIELNELLLEQTKEADNPQLEIEQLQNLSSVYFDNANEGKGEELLRQAYELSIARGQTLDAKRSVELLAAYYRKNRRTTEALNLYSAFTGKLDTLIKADSSLIDARIFQINEEKISQLEKERILKDELIRKKNAFNNSLIAVLIMILVFLFVMVRAWLSIRVKNKKIALQSLRREMNPHFIFNSLNSVNQFIAQNNELEANKYLSSYSKLMRTVMENSNKDFIPLSVELEQIKEYLQLENMRFADKFTYDIEVDEALDADAVFIPNMLIQPQLENAIWHGLRYKDEKGHLLLKIRKKKTHLSVFIIDNGIGIQKSEAWKTPRQKEHKSRGLTNTYERIELLNKLYHTNIKLTIKEKEGEETGVIVEIQIPYDSFQTQPV
ncbi:MAG: histidine kinase [Tannerellaceae bacterium]|nr:histidine kinase [Tannerellaceae bacterium]